MSRVRIGALIAATVMTVAACSGSTATTAPASQAPATQAPAATEAPASAAPATEAPSSAAPSAAIKDGGTLVVALPGDIKRTDSALVDDGNSGYVFQNVMQSLVGLAPGSTSKIIDVLAASHTVSPDGLTYTFTLRTASSSTTAPTSTPTPSCTTTTGGSTSPRTCRATATTPAPSSAATARIRTSSPSRRSTRRRSRSCSTSRAPASCSARPCRSSASPARRPSRPAARTTRVTDVSKITYAQGGPPALVGTGPFKFEKWVKGSEIDIVKNAAYWDPAGVAPPGPRRVQADRRRDRDPQRSPGRRHRPRAEGQPGRHPDAPGRQAVRGHQSWRELQPVPPGPQPELPGPRPEGRQQLPDHDQSQDPAGDHVRHRPPVADRQLLRGPGDPRRQLDAAGNPVLQGREPADVRPRRRPSS